MHVNPARGSACFFPRICLKREGEGPIFSENIDKSPASFYNYVTM